MSDAIKERSAKLRASPADYLPLAREIESGAVPGLKPWKVSFLSSFTAEPIKPFVIVESACVELKCEPWFGPFNQFEQQVFDTQSDLYRQNSDVIVLALRLEEIAAGLVDRIPSKDELESTAISINGRIKSLLSAIRSNSAARILIWNFAPTVSLPGGLADCALDVPQMQLVQQLNQMIAEICKGVSDTYVFDLHRLVYECGMNATFDKRLYFLGRIPIGPEAQRQIGRRLARTFNALARPPKKCLVLDLDNTLWGGVVGEDGLGGIALSEDYPGNVYKAFQRYILTLRDRGVLLAIASKNNREDALEVFEHHPDCILKLSHFASIQVGWQHKAESLRTIAHELNIGTDALVFFDDNPAERELVRQAIPEVTVLDAPGSPLGYSDAIEAAGVFDFLVLSEEDRRRAVLYQQDKERESLQRTAETLPDFLRSLDMRAVCGHVDDDTLPRVAQLLAKTNQFNTTTRRYTATQLQQISNSGGIALWLRLTDRFGDNGLVGVAIAVADTKHQWRVDCLLLSCRVISRGAEYVLLRELSRLIRDRDGVELIGEFLPTPKNLPAKDVFAGGGFEALDGQGRKWRWNLSDGVVPAPEYIDTRFEESASA